MNITKLKYLDITIDKYFIHICILIASIYLANLSINFLVSASLIILIYLFIHKRILTAFCVFISIPLFLIVHNFLVSKFETSDVTYGENISIEVSIARKVSGGYMGDCVGFLNVDNSWSKCKTKILLNSSNKYYEGEILRIKANQELVWNKEEFSDGYKSYLSGIGISTYVGSYELQDKRVGNLVYYSISRFREKILGRIQSLFPEPNSSIVAGLLLGKVVDFDKDLEQKFKDSGTMHIMVVSGFNVSIIILSVQKFLVIFSKYLRITIILSLIFVFAVLTGMEASILRASIMGAIPLFGLVIGRKLDTNVTLLIACLIMGITSPGVYSQISFQLSFLATFGILNFADLFTEKLSKLPSLISVNLATTLSAYFMVIPILSFNFQTLNLVGIVSNLFVLDLIPIIMLFSFISILLAILLPIYLNLVAFVTKLLTSLLLWIIQLFAELSIFNFNFEISRNWLFLYYVFIILIYFERSYDRYGKIV